MKKFALTLALAPLALIGVACSAPVEDSAEPNTMAADAPLVVKEGASKDTKEVKLACYFADNNTPTRCLLLEVDQAEHPDLLFFAYIEAPKRGGEKFISDFKLNVRLQSGGDDDYVSSSRIGHYQSVRIADLPCGLIAVQGQATGSNGGVVSESANTTGAQMINHECQGANPSPSSDAGTTPSS